MPWEAFEPILVKEREDLRDSTPQPQAALRKQPVQQTVTEMRRSIKRPARFEDDGSDGEPCVCMKACLLA